MNQTFDTGGGTAPSGELALQVTRDLGNLKTRKSPSLTWKIKNFLQHKWRGVPALLTYRFLGNLFGLVWLESSLSLQVMHADGTVTDYGVVSRRVVTTAGVNAIVDAFQGLFTLSNFKYHGFGTGTTAEAVGDTALVTELTTQYATDNTRPTGSQTEAAANIYSSVATLSPDSGANPLPITEHGLFSAATGVTLLDRTVFAAVNLVPGSDSLQATYNLTVASGG